MHYERILIFGSRVLLAILLVMIGVFVSQHPPQQWQLNSSLKSLSPDFVKDSGVQGALSQLSSSIERQFVVLIVSEDIDDTEEAHEEFRSRVQESAPFFALDPLENLDAYLSLMREHRFHLMTEEQSLWLKSASNEELFAYTQSRLFGLAGSAQALSLNQDPFGFASNFIASAGDQSISYDEAVEFTYDGTTHYFMPVIFKIKGDALAIDVQTDVLDTLAQIEHSVKDSYRSVSFMHSGIIFFAADAAKKSKQDISMIGLGSGIGIVLLLLLVFRSLKPLALPLLSVLFGVSLAFVVTYQLFDGIHILTIVFGASLIGVAIDYSLHYFYHQTSIGASSHSSELYRALTFSLFTSIIGYAALSLSGLESLKHVAIFSVIGLGGAWLMVLAAGPFFVGGNARGHSAILSFLTERLLGFFSKLSLRLFSIVGVGAITLFVVIYALNFNTSDDPRVFFTPDPALLSEEQAVGENISSYEPGTFVVIRGESSAEIFDGISRIRSGIGNEESSRLLGLHRFLPSPVQQEKYYAQYRRLLGPEGAAMEVLDRLGISKIAQDALLRDLKKQEARYLFPPSLLDAMGEAAPNLWVQSGSTFYSFLLIPRVFDKAALAKIADRSENIFFINSAELAKDAIREQRESAFLMVVCAIILVSLLVMLRHRNLRYLNLVLVPASAIAVTLCMFQLLSVPVTLFHVMALFLVLGLGMDYVIFVSEIADNQDLTLQAILLSALTSLMSFGLLSLSSIPVVQAFGATVLIGNTVNFIGACWLASSFNSAAPLRTDTTSNRQLS